MSKADKKAKEAMAFFATMLKDSGVDEEVLQESLSEPFEVKLLQAEGVLLFLESAGKALIHRVCKECGEAFASRYKAVAYCSDRCRSKKLRRDFGIQWSPQRDHYQMMDAERPLVVGPQAYQTLLEFAHRILEGQVEVDQSLTDTSDPHTNHQVSPDMLESPLELPPAPSLESLGSGPFGIASPFDPLP